MAVIKFKPNEKTEFERLFDQLLNNINDSGIKSTKKTRKIQVSKDDIFHKLVDQIFQALDVYNSNEHIDDWSFSLEIGNQYHGQQDEDIINKHTSLISAQQNNLKINLTIRYERGGLYNFIKDTKYGLWGQFCKNNLNVCSNTANRYKDLLRYIYNIITYIIVIGILTSSS
jgi:hypothetical protein